MRGGAARRAPAFGCLHGISSATIDASVRVLVTGFGPFSTNRDNPSDALARAMRGRRLLGVDFCVRSPLPVEYAHAAALVLRDAEAVGAHAIVALGLAAGSPRIRVELIAKNHCTSRDVDGAGCARHGRPAVPGAPPALRATLDPRPIRAALAAFGIQSARSQDAGGYVCNDLFYRLLQSGRRALFVHVPSDVAVRRVAEPLAAGIARAVIASASRVDR